MTKSKTSHGLSVVDLPEGDVLVRVEYSDVNYKDGMVVNGIGGLVQDYRTYRALISPGLMKNPRTLALRSEIRSF